MRLHPPAAASARSDGDAAPSVLALIALWLALPLSALLAPAPARANSEEFSSFAVERQEEDDESLLDHMLTRTPREWRAEWERAPLAFRTSQGCLTSGQWIMVNDLKLCTPLGKRSLFDLHLRQSRDDKESFDYLDLGFRRSLGRSSAALFFSPTYNKSEQDLTLQWELGADTTALQVLARFTIEDLFNNLWEFRQSRAGQASEPYMRHPYEPEIRVVSRRDRLRIEAGGRWLTPGTKKIEGLNGPGAVSIRTLWGALAYASIELRALGLQWEASGATEQAKSGERPDSARAGDYDDFRRQWSAEIAVHRALNERLTATGRWLYQGRTQRYGAAIVPGAFDGVDRLGQLEIGGRLGSAVSLRVGGLYDRITIARSGTPRFSSYGTRKESRVYLALTARFGRVSVQGVEGIELDREPYEVSFHHDKGFLQLQTTF